MAVFDFRTPLVSVSTERLQLLDLQKKAREAVAPMSLPASRGSERSRGAGMDSCAAATNRSQVTEQPPVPNWNNGTTFIGASALDHLAGADLQ